MTVVWSGALDREIAESNRRRTAAGAPNADGRDVDRAARWLAESGPATLPQMAAGLGWSQRRANAALYRLRLNGRARVSAKTPVRTPRGRTARFYETAP